MSRTKHYTIASALAVVMMTGATSIASAHTDVDCYLPKKAYCEANHAAGSAAARACKVNARKVCQNHDHFSAGVPQSPAPNMKKGFGLRRR